MPAEEISSFVRPFMHEALWQQTHHSLRKKLSFVYAFYDPYVIADPVTMILNTMSGYAPSWHGDLICSAGEEAAFELCDMIKDPNESINIANYPENKKLSGDFLSS